MHSIIRKHRLMRRLLLVLLACSAAQGQRLIALTQAMTATREAAALYMQSLNIENDVILPCDGRVPGRISAGRLHFSPDERFCLISSEARDESIRDPRYAVEMWLSIFENAPFQRRYAFPIQQNPGEKLKLNLVYPDAGGNGYLALFTGETGDTGLVPRYFYRVMRLPGTKQSEPETLFRDELPGKPVDCVHIPERSCFVFLCGGETGREPFLTVTSAAASEAGMEVIGISSNENSAGATPVSLRLTEDRRCLIALLTGYDFTNPAGEDFSRIAAFRTADFRPAGGVQQLKGRAEFISPVVNVSGRSCFWVGVRDPGTEFARAARFCFERSGAPEVIGHLVRDAEYALSGITREFHIAASPLQGDIAVALDNRLEIWSGGERSMISAAYEEPICFLRWTEKGLIAGETGRIHLIDTITAMPLRTVQLQTGWIRDAVLLPDSAQDPGDSDGDGLIVNRELQLKTDYRNPDTDGDGIHDGIDPEPLKPSPALKTPFSITLQGEGAGREFKALLPLQENTGGSPAWKILNSDMPWLKIYPLQGTGKSPAYLFLNPEQYTPGTYRQGRLRVEMTGTRPDKAAAYSPADIWIRAVPASFADESGTPLRRILWLTSGAYPGSLRDEGNPERLNDLLDLLAGPPFYFSHVESAAPWTGDLSPWSAVVLSMEAAARGTVTRAALLDYVMQGGALLFLGARLPEDGGAFPGNWLSPAGFQVIGSEAVSGRFPAVSQEVPARYWENFAIEAGALILAPPESIRVPETADTNRAVFAVRQYGYGRMALLAGAAPLENTNLETRTGRLFAGDLFRWLVRGRHHYQDMDSDGLSDEIEDPDNNGITGPRETDFLNPDTDGDLIPDGLEDLNRNGRVDDGETDPRNPDSDGDGIYDGADARPAPVYGAPRLFTVEPDNGAAEGGTLTAINGRNLPPGGVFWFGGRKAVQARIVNGEFALVRTPPCSREGLVDVRLTVPGSNVESVLPGGFNYTPRNKVHILLSMGSPPRREAGGWRGRLAVEVIWPENTWAGGAGYLELNAFPATGFSWGAVHPGPYAAQADQNVEVILNENNVLRVQLGPGRYSRNRTGELLHIDWRLRQPDAAEKNLRFSVKHALFIPRQYSVLGVESKALEVTLD
jgi:hypothetical protein